jgi:hypothetical protein
MAAPNRPGSRGLFSDDDYGQNYLQAEAIIVRLIHHDNEEHLYTAIEHMTPANPALPAAQ